MPTLEEKKAQIDKVLEAFENYLFTVARAMYISTKKSEHSDPAPMVQAFDAIPSRRKKLLDEIEAAGKL